MKARNLKKIITGAALSFLIVINTTLVYAAGGSGDVSSGIDSWGNSGLGILLTLLKWACTFGIIVTACGIAFINDETIVKRMKIGLGVTITGAFLGWFAQPIANTFLK